MGGPKPLKLLFVTDGAWASSEIQLLPIIRYATLLQSQLGVVTQTRKTDAALKLNAHSLTQFDLIGLKLSFQTPAVQAERLVKDFKAKIAGAPTKLVYFDGDDDANVQWPEVLRIVDLYVKKQAFAENKAYLYHYVGKSNLTDYVSKNYNVSFADNIIPTSGGLDPVEVEKIYVGWNLALDEPILELLRRVKSISFATKDLDILCRASVPQDNWLYHLRNPAVACIEAMSNRFRVLAPRDRVSRNQYWGEMLRSKICVSPFGYGEICWRDFEAIMCGALLVKPDMSHLKTLPDLFVPGVTYVPVRWDYSDLEAKCAYYLHNEEERMLIGLRARDLLVSNLKPDWFLDRFKDLIAHVWTK